MAIPSYLIFCIVYSVTMMCAELLFAEKWRPTKAIGHHFSAKKQLSTHPLSQVIIQNIR